MKEEPISEQTNGGLNFGGEVEVVLIQLLVGMNKAENLRRAETLINQAVRSDRHPDVVCLPECFNSPYGNEYFAHYAESLEPPGETVEWLQRMAALHNVYIVGGSIPEYNQKDDRFYNTCLVYEPEGRLVAIHRKLHLFDVNIRGKLVFKESATLSAGSHLTYFEAIVPIRRRALMDSSRKTHRVRFGICICYDIRFPEVTLVASLKHACHAMLVPAAFNMETGPKHWELLLRSRAMDGQMFVVGVSPARNLDASYVTYSHSMVVNPWSEVIKDAGIQEGVHRATLNLDQVREVREAIPTRIQRRDDLYTLEVVL